MKPFFVSEITTKDGLIHQGILFMPKKKGKRALLWIHGLTGKFYGDTKIMNEFADACEEHGFGFASFNNRGHDQIAGVTKSDQTYGEIGAGLEIFEECVLDIHAAVDFLVAKGFSEIILVGHSTGANKACFSEGMKPHKNVAGIVLAGPISDRIGSDLKNLARMERIIADGKGDELITGLSFFPMTPKRYLSLYKKGSAEDVFDYDEEKNGLSVFSRITKPLFVIVSENDECSDRPALDLIKVFNAKTKSTTYKSLVFSGANHGFDGKEKEAVRTISAWIASI